MSESIVQVLPDSSGKKIRTLEVTKGVNTVEQQVIVVGNERGDLMPTLELLTAFGYNRVAQPLTLFDTKFLYDKQPLFWAEALTGAGSSNQASAVVTMGVTSGTDSATRQSKQWFNYQAGKSQLVFLTGVFSQQTNVTKRVGYFNGVDGIYLKVTGSAITLEILKGSSVSESVAQGSWNLDTLNGSGPSAVTLDFTKTQILVIDFQWLGVGRVRVGFIVGGRLLYCHAFDHSNVATSPYMNNPNLPIRYDITSTGGAGTMSQICGTVISEGGSDTRGLVYSVDMDETTVTLPNNTNVIGLIFIRLASGKLSTSVRVTDIEMMATNNGNAHWHLILNPTSVAGTALSYNAVANTGIEVALGIANNVVTGGTHLDSGYLSGTARQTSALSLSTLRLGSDLAGASDVLCLGMVNVNGGAVVLASMGLREDV